MFSKSRKNIHVEENSVNVAAITAIDAQSNIAHEAALHSAITAIQQEKPPKTAKVESLSDLKPYVFDLLYNNPSPAITKFFEVIEEKTGISRDNIVGGALLLVAVYLIIGSGAELVCNTIGFGYPAYASVLAIRTPEKTDDTEWLMYWTVFASFSLVDFYAESIMSIVPLYWVCKALFLLYLALPQTRGASIIYWTYVDPFVTQAEKFAKNWAAKHNF